MPIHSLMLLVISALLPVCGAGLEAEVKSAILQPIPYPSSFNDARATYQGVDQQIRNVLPKTESEQYEILVSFPTSDCFEYHAEDKNYGAGIVNFTGYNGVNVFVGKYDRNKDKTKAFREASDVNKSQADNAMGMTFDSVGSQYDAKFDNLCYRIKEVDDYTMGKLINAHFRVLIGFRCARRFVWYELGWHFYEAFWTSSEYVFHYNDRRSDWGNSCGTFVFFP